MNDNKQGAIRLNRREAINIGLGTVLNSAVAATGAGFAAATRWAGADDKPLHERLVTDFGAKPDDDGLQTAAIQAAIDAAADRGGGTIRFPKGRFLSGAIRYAAWQPDALDRYPKALGGKSPTLSNQPLKEKKYETVEELEDAKEQSFHQGSCVGVCFRNAGWGVGGYGIRGAESGVL
jgi:hypothetical protein